MYMLTLEELQHCNFVIQAAAVQVPKPPPYPSQHNPKRRQNLPQLKAQEAEVSYCVQNVHGIYDFDNPLVFVK